MEQVIRRLLELQRLDLHILALKAEREGALKELDDGKKGLEDHQRRMEAERERARRLQIDMKELDLELEDGKEKRRRLEAQQAAVKTNQEYKALSKEILDTQAHIRLIEERMLEKMEAIEEETRNQTTMARETERHKEELRGQESRLQQRLKEIAEDLEKAQRDRTDAAASIEQPFLGTYQRIFRKKQGVAVVPIMGRTCRGCNLAVTPQVENLARRKDSLVICENCSRILYMPSEEEINSAAGS